VQELFGEFLVCRIAEDAAHCIVAASVPDKFGIFQKFLKIFSATPRLFYYTRATGWQNPALFSRINRDLRLLKRQGDRFRMY
jgi:hypothetical protein